MHGNKEDENNWLVTISNHLQICVHGDLSKGVKKRNEQSDKMTKVYYFLLQILYFDRLMVVTLDIFNPKYVQMNYEKINFNWKIDRWAKLHWGLIYYL